MGRQGIGNVFLIILYLILILVGAYFATKAVGRLAMRRGMKRQPSKEKKGGGIKALGKFSASNGQFLEVVDRIPVDRDKSMFVLEFEGKRYLMSATAQELRLVDKREIPQEELARRNEEKLRLEKEAERETPAQGTFMENMKSQWNLRFGRKKMLTPDQKGDGSSFEEKFEKELDKENRQ